MLKVIHCPYCHEALQSDSEWVGQTTSCPFCHKQFTILQEQEDTTVGEPTSTHCSLVNTDRASCWRYFINCLTKKYCCFEGRASRKEYWSYQLILLLLLALIAIVTYVPFDKLEDVVCCLSVVLSVLTFVLILPGIGVSIRRLHDVGCPGWVFFLQFIPFISAITTTIFFVLTLLPSQPHPNKYGDGPDPE